MVVVLVEGYRMITNPLIQSEEKIKEELLQLVPFGTQMENVIQLVKCKEEWFIREVNNENGFLYQGKAQRKVVGEKSVRVYLGEYRTIKNLYLPTDVSVFFGFNTNVELIDVWVWKTVNGL